MDGELPVLYALVRDEVHEYNLRNTNKPLNIYGLLDQLARTIGRRHLAARGR